MTRLVRIHSHGHCEILHASHVQITTVMFLYMPTNSCRACNLLWPNDFSKNANRSAMFTRMHVIGICYICDVKGSVCIVLAWLLIAGRDRYNFRYLSYRQVAFLLLELWLVHAYCDPCGMYCQVQQNECYNDVSQQPDNEHVDLVSCNYNHIDVQ